MPARFDPADLPEFPDLSFEKNLWSQGLTRIGGVDEAGRGSWAGPVCAAVVVLPDDADIQDALCGVRDSKLMTPSSREEWAECIKENCTTWGVGFASPGEIDTYGIIPSTRMAVRRALECLPEAPGHLLIDYLLLPDCEIPQTSLVKGDRRSLSVAAASVLAKTSRDSLMRELDGEFPGYGFGRHKGYGTKMHQEAIRELGLCGIHRKTYRLIGG